MWIRTKEERILKSDIYALSKAKKYGKRIEDLCDEFLIARLDDENAFTVSEVCEYDKYLEIAKEDYDKIEIVGCIKEFAYGNDKDFYRSRLCVYLFKYHRFVPFLLATKSNYEGDEDIERWLKENK